MEKTPTPIIYVEDIRLNDLSINGSVFSTASDGTRIPEAGAFVYVYLNDLLSNERASFVDARGAVSRTGYVTITATDGTWSCPISSLRSGLRITAVAHASGKSISDPSVPYRVGSLPVPTGIHTIDRYGQYSGVKHGQRAIEGFFEGLHNRKYDANSDLPEEAYAFPYVGNFTLCPYINGVKQDCLPDNEVWGRNFLDQIVDLTWAECFTILVQDEPVNICLDNITGNIYSQILTYYDLYRNGSQVTNQLPINPPTDEGLHVIIHVYKNGYKLAEGLDRDYVLWTGAAPSVVFNAGIVPDVNDIYQCDYLVVAEADFPYYENYSVENSTQSVFGISKGFGLQVFKNGLRQKEGVDFTVQGDPSNKAVFLTEPLSGLDALELSYFDPPTNSVEHRIETTTAFTATVETNAQGTAAVRSTLRVSLVGMNPLPQMLLVYKNGVRLAYGAVFDYTGLSASPSYVEYVLDDDNQWGFEVESETVDGPVYVVTDNIVVDVMYSEVSSSRVEAVLNALPEFIANKLHAVVVEQTVGGSTVQYLTVTSPYTLGFLDGDTSYYNTFGQNPALIPGKDEDGNFKYFVDFKNNRWRYTFSKPLERLQSITAATFLRT